jgi:hypothetical protein
LLPSRFAGSSNQESINAAKHPLEICNLQSTFGNSDMSREHAKLFGVLRAGA